MSSFFILIFFISILAFLLGMIVPAVFTRFFKNGVTRIKIAKLFGAIMFGSLFAGVATATPIAPTSNANIDTTQAQPASSSGLAVDSAAITNEPSAGASSRTSASVIRVVDGDTVKVDINGVQGTIRIIGINTPETVDPRKPVECFGKEASTKAHELLDNQTVSLEVDTTQGERDKYGRLLRFIFLSNGTDFGKQMIADGYAYEYTYSTPYIYQQDYKTAQSVAENAKRGLWADDVCSAAQTESASPSSSTTATSSTCSCSSNIYNCSDFSTHAAAQSVYNCCMAQVGKDVHGLDGSDNDGLACESLP